MQHCLEMLAWEDVVLEPGCVQALGHMATSYADSSPDLCCAGACGEAYFLG